MKTRAVPILISIIFIFASHTFAENTDSPSNTAINDSNNQNVDILISEGDTASLSTNEQPAPGPEEITTKIPDTIVHFLLISKGSISGLAWYDSNGNRLVDLGEQGIENVRIYVDYDSSKTYTSSDPFTRTDANGRYTLPRVKTGDRSIYIDTSTIPGGYEITTIHPYIVDVGRNQNVDNADFGIKDISASITGYVWNDSDGNGSLDNSESPIPNVTVYVDLNNDDEYTLGEPMGTTDANGYYMIQRLSPGTFMLHVDNGTLSAEYHRTPVYGTNPSLVSVSSDQNTQLRFGYQKKVSILGILKDFSGNTWANVTLFIDLNGNGIYDEGEPVTRTNLFGRYIFNDLLAGTYTVMILSSHLPGGYDLLVSPGEITTHEGENYTADFLTQAQPVTIAGFAWSDESGNSRRETNENGLAGITVFLDTNNNSVLDGAEQSTLTDATGAYSFSGLVHGDYTIRADDSALLPAYLPTTPNPVVSNTRPGEITTDGKFGYQRKIAPVSTMLSPTRISWENDGNLYVSDHRVGSVYIFDSTLTLMSELKGLDTPLGIVTDGSGNIYVGSQGRKGVVVYDAWGNLLTTVASGTIEIPNDLAFDNNTLYVLDSVNDTVLVFNSAGSQIASIGDSTQIDYAVSIAINYRDDGTGNQIGELYIADQPKCTIHIFGLDGTYKNSVGSCGTMYTVNWDGLFSGLVAVDVDQHGNIHGLDNNLNVVQVFKPQNGTFDSSYNAYPVENENRLNLQSDISINPADNRVVISNTASQNVELIHTVP